jgi:hypothetical protein
MNGAEGTPQLVTAKLPSGEAIRIELSEPRSGDGMTSVGLTTPDLSAALDRVGEIGSLVMDKLKEAKPSKTTVELRFGFAVEAGKLTALWVGGKGEASLTVTMEWSGADASAGPPVPAEMTVNHPAPDATSPGG